VITSGEQGGSQHRPYLLRHALRQLRNRMQPGMSYRKRFPPRLRPALAFLKQG
jgi:hypothetical protein